MNNPTMIMFALAQAIRIGIEDGLKTKYPDAKIMGVLRTHVDNGSEIMIEAHGVRFLVSVKPVGVNNG